MHLLAHAVLAHISLASGDCNPQDSAEYITGSVMADFFTGEDLSNYSPAVRLAILQHRAIDVFTDSHPVFVRSRRMIDRSGAPRLSSAILADVFWGHLLASCWTEFAEPLCEVSLAEFNTFATFSFERASEWHSPSFTGAVRWIKESSFLEHISTRNGIEQSLRGLSRRMRRAEKLHESIRILDDCRDQLLDDLRLFWPDVVRFSCDYPATEF